MFDDSTMMFTGALISCIAIGWRLIGVLIEWSDYLPTTIEDVISDYPTRVCTLGS